MYQFGSIFCFVLMYLDIFTKIRLKRIVCKLLLSFKYSNGIKLLNRAARVSGELIYLCKRV